MSRFLPSFKVFALCLSASVFSLAVADAQSGRRETLPAPVALATAPTETQPAKVETTAKKPGIAFCVAVRTKLRQEYRKQGKGLIESIRLANQATDAVIAGLIDDAEALAGVKIVGTAIGDGKIIDAILDFFKSPQGQALLDALLKLLLGLLAQAEPGSAQFYALLEMIGHVQMIRSSG